MENKPIYQMKYYGDKRNNFLMELVMVGLMELESMPR